MNPGPEQAVLAFLTHAARYTFWGSPDREHLTSKKPWKPLTSPQQWLDWQMVAYATKTAGGPGSGGPVLDKPYLILELDETKREIELGLPARDLDTILAEVPDNWVCAVPSRTPGHWQIVYAFDKPISTNVMASLRQSILMYGSDPRFNQGSLSWSAPYRTIHPSPSGETTVWSSLAQRGVIPTVTAEDLRHPDAAYAPSSTRIVSEQERAYRAASLDAKVSVLTGLRDGDGRYLHLSRYLWDWAYQFKKTRGQLPTLNQMGAESDRINDTVLGEPLSQARLRGLVEWRYTAVVEHTRVQAARRMHNPEAMVNFTRKNRERQTMSIRLYFMYYDTLQGIKRLYGRPHEATGDLRVHQQRRAREYTGRKFSANHVAYVLNIYTEDIDTNTGEVVYNVGGDTVAALLKRGRDRGYTRAMAAQTFLDEVEHWNLPQGEIEPQSATGER